jgi:hypothetical protein
VWRSGGIAPSFLTSALVGGECSASLPGRFIPRQWAHGIHSIGGWKGLRAGSYAVEERIRPRFLGSSFHSPSLDWLSYLGSANLRFGATGLEMWRSFYGGLYYGYFSVQCKTRWRQYIMNDEFLGSECTNTSLLRYVTADIGAATAGTRGGETFIPKFSGQVYWGNEHLGRGNKRITLRWIFMIPQSL